MACLQNEDKNTYPPELLLEINVTVYVYVTVSNMMPGMWHSGNACRMNKQTDSRIAVLWQNAKPSLAFHVTTNKRNVGTAWASLRGLTRVTRRTASLLPGASVTLQAPSGVWVLIESRRQSLSEQGRVTR